MDQSASKLPYGVWLNSSFGEQAVRLVKASPIASTILSHVSSLFFIVSIVCLYCGTSRCRRCAVDGGGYADDKRVGIVKIVEMVGPAGAYAVVVADAQGCTAYGDFDGKEVVHVEPVVPGSEFHDARMISQVKNLVIAFAKARGEKQVI